MPHSYSVALQIRAFPSLPICPFFYSIPQHPSVNLNDIIITCFLSQCSLQGISKTWIGRIEIHILCHGQSYSRLELFYIQLFFHKHFTSIFFFFLIRLFLFLRQKEALSFYIWNSLRSHPFFFLPPPPFLLFYYIQCGYFTEKECI